MFNDIMLTAMLREIKRRQDSGIPSAEQLRTLMIFCEEQHRDLAMMVRMDAVWERFQQQYNDPTRDIRRKYGMVCRDLFEEGFVKYAFAIGYTETLDENIHIEVKRDSVTRKFKIRSVHSKDGTNASADYERPLALDVWVVIDHLVKPYTFQGN